MEIVLLALCLWGAPSILLSAVVVYQALRRDWREAPTVAWTGRAYGIVGMEQLIEVDPTEHITRRPKREGDRPEAKRRTGGDRAGIRPGRRSSGQGRFSEKRTRP